MACFVFRRENCHPAFSDFCNTIGTERPLPAQPRRSAYRGVAEFVFHREIGGLGGRLNLLTDIRAGYLGGEVVRKAMRHRLPDFSVVVWLRKTDKFAMLKAELLGAAVAEPYESTEYQGMVDFHWSAANFAEAKRLAEALRGTAQHPELVLLHIMSRVDGLDSISIKDERQRIH